jgi:hypothetical protein
VTADLDTSNPQVRAKGYPAFQSLREAVLTALSATAATRSAFRTAVKVHTLPGFDLVSGRWYRVPQASSLSTTPPATALLHFTPKFIANETVTIDRLGAEVSAAGEAGSLVRLGIYADDGTGRPGALVLDAGTILGDSATVQSITVSQTLTRGWYWFAMVNQNVVTTNPTWRILATTAEAAPMDTISTPAAGGVVLSLTQAAVTGALPATATPAGRAVYGVAAHVRVL